MLEALIKKWHDHGVSVNEWYEELCKNPEQIGNDKVIEFFKGYTRRDLSKYHINHDISKPYVRVVDSEGKEHYPDHSKHSHELYVKRYGHDEFADMILHDMDFHNKRGDELKEVWSLPFSKDLYATAWAEVYANAGIFGGQCSDSFKIKRKRLIKALNKL